MKPTEQPAKAEKAKRLSPDSPNARLGSACIRPALPDFGPSRPPGERLEAGRQPNSAVGAALPGAAALQNASLPGSEGRWGRTLALIRRLTVHHPIELVYDTKRGDGDRLDHGALSRDFSSIL